MTWHCRDLMLAPAHRRPARLAGQQPRYLERTMLEYKSNGRSNAPDKSVTMRGYEDEEIISLANYLAVF